MEKRKMKSRQTRVSVFYVALFAAIVCSTSCKKDSNTPAASTGGNPSPNSTEYIKFKLDGTLLDMTVPQAPIFILYTNFSDYTMMQFGGGALLGNTHYSTLNLVFDSLDVPPIQLQQPEVDDRTFVVTVGHFVTPGSSESNQYYFPHDGSTGTMMVDQLERQVGGFVSGTFSYTNLMEVNMQGDTLSYDHTITEGEFRLRVTE